MSEERNLTLEERFANLENIIHDMEDSNVSLDTSFELYKAGMEEIKQCNGMLDAMEKAMLVINEKGELEGFE